MTGSLALPADIDRSEVIGFELTRSFRQLDYQIDPEKNPTYQLLKALPSFLSASTRQLQELTRA